MDLDFVDELTKRTNGVKWPLVRLELIDRMLDAKRKEKEDS